ncbi:MAG TPA: 2-oxo acid dehydrogenase subunit E2, partial [Terriglobales bacterium]|nr:2-oxo acid dehydrogenase subunit E2 [Terriglobales bacterium]
MVKAPERTGWSEYRSSEFFSSDWLGNMLLSNAPPCSLVSQYRRGARVNVALAVATDDGLLAPVIHDADRLALVEIAARRTALVAAA